MTAESRAPGQSGMALLSEVLLALHRGGSLAAVMGAAATGAGRFGAACQVGCLVQDPATNGWFLTSLLDASGQAIPFERLGVPPGPFPFRAPAAAAAGGLTAVFGEAWGLGPCAQLERQTGSSRVILTPVTAGGVTLGALFALTPGAEHNALLAAVLTHAATAAGRLLTLDGGTASDGVLGPAAFADLAERELLRAERYRREVSMAVFGMDSTREVAHFGPMLVRTLRRWDIVGRPEGDQPVLAALLPETGRTGCRGLVRRLNRLIGSTPVGTAVAPEDGWKLERLLEVATNAMKLAPSYRAPVGLTGVELWSRGLPASGDSESVRCPRCLVSYVRRRPVGLPEDELEEQRERARAALRVACPRHEDRMNVGR